MKVLKFPYWALAYFAAMLFLAMVIASNMPPQIKFGDNQPGMTDWERWQDKAQTALTKRGYRLQVDNPLEFRAHQFEACAAAYVMAVGLTLAVIVRCCRYIPSPLDPKDSHK